MTGEERAKLELQRTGVVEALLLAAGLAKGISIERFASVAARVGDQVVALRQTLHAATAAN